MYTFDSNSPPQILYNIGACIMYTHIITIYLDILCIGTFLKYEMSTHNYAIAPIRMFDEVRKVLHYNIFIIFRRKQ